MKNEDEKVVSKKERSLLFAVAMLVIGLLVLVIAGVMMIKPADKTVQGQADATSVRVSGKLMGRVAEFYVEEGAKVKAGDTLVHITSNLADAQLYQAQAMQNVAAQQSSKVDAGARTQVIQGAHDLWQQAIAAETITKKTYERMENLFKEGVVSEQKRDEAKAAYTAAKAQASAAKSQYDLAKAGAQNQDKEAARSLENAAKGTVMQVESLLEDQYLLAPCDGEISEIFPNVGELVAAGAPVMNVMRDDTWVTFNVREELLKDIPMGAEVEVMIPALGEKKAKCKVFYIKDMGSYAVWSATKATGQYDSRTFQIKARPTEKIENFRPGMSVILLEK